MSEGAGSMALDKEEGKEKRNQELVSQENCAQEGRAPE